MKGYYNEFRKRLEAGGYEYLRQGTGSHEVWWDLKTKVKVTLVLKTNSRHTANSILKHAGLPKAF